MASQAMSLFVLKYGADITGRCAGIENDSNIMKRKEYQEAGNPLAVASL